ncbi:MAG: DUF72 domain-containing protein [Candidatus Bathyarchaeia archaeon]|nr:DUF72 domain-containing protein [Candidatus Bathyarchaeota archaeon]
MIKVGCCGFPVSQSKYYETFILVELNTTFYRYPSLKTVEGWRKKAPENFEFTVKAHQDISHKYKLNIEWARESFEKVKQICRILRARIILIQTPASFTVKSINDAEDFFKRVEREDLVLVWETRGPTWESEEGLKILRDSLSKVNVTHVTDPLRLMPAYVADVAYFRLHGLGERLYYYQYTNDELRKLHETVKKYEGLEMGVYVLFNNLAMFDDAKRFKFYIENGYFPPLTGNYGMDAIKALIGSARYPATKKALIDRIGWRLVEIEPNRQVKLGDLLNTIPEGTYKSSEELLEELKGRVSF